MSASSRETDWATWMRAAMAGDAQAYRQFLQGVTPHLRAVARSQCRSFGAPDGEAEDVVQEALLTIHLKRGTWDPSRPIGPWIAAITRNKLIDVLRRRGRHVVVPIDDVVESLRAEEQAADVTARELDGLLGALRAQQQDIVRSISLDGRSVRETAERLHMTEGAVRVALHRALKSLAALYRNRSRED